MEPSLVGTEGSDEASLLGSEVGSSVDFLIGGPGSEMGSMEEGLIRASWVPQVYPRRVPSSSSSDSSG